MNSLIIDQMVVKERTVKTFFLLKYGLRRVGHPVDNESLGNVTNQLYKLKITCISDCSCNHLNSLDYLNFSER